MCIPHFVYSVIDGHLCCFHLLTIGNTAARNTGVQTTIQTFLSFAYVPRNGITQSYCSSIFRFFFFWGTSVLFSKEAAPFYIALNCVRVPVSPHFPTLVIIVSLIVASHPNGCEVVPHCHFNLHFLNGQWCSSSFHVLVGDLYVIFWEIAIQVLCWFLTQIVYFLL